MVRLPSLGSRCPGPEFTSRKRGLDGATDPLAGEVINDGNWYPASFDKPHIASLVANYKFTQRVSLKRRAYGGTSFRKAK